MAATEPLARVAVANEGISESAHFGSNPKLPANSARCTLDGDERIVGAREDFGEVAIAEVAAEQRSHEEIGGLFGECLRPSRRRSRSETEVVDHDAESEPHGAEGREGGEPLKAEVPPAQHAANHQVSCCCEPCCGIERS